MPETKYKRAKNSRLRGSHTHGGGSMKKRRGAGHRGGRGNAGSGKRGDSNKPTFIVAQRRYGRFGFTTPHQTANKVLNVGDIQKKIDAQIKKGTAKKQPQYAINLKAVDKLLGTGQVTAKLDITVKYASPTAIQKIQAAGGSVTLTAKPEPAQTKESQE